METIEICPQILYSFEAEKKLVDEVLEEVKKIKFKDNTKNLVSEDVFFNKNLLDWFDVCLLELQKKIYPNIERLVITSCWANKTNKTQQHHTHSHPNSFVSGIFYLTDHDSAKTNFMIENLWYKFDSNWLTYLHQKNSLVHKVNPKKGQLILFPSHLPHNTDVLDFKEKEERYSISFNTFLTGKLGQDNNTLKITLDVKDYRDTDVDKKIKLP